MHVTLGIYMQLLHLGQGHNIQNKVIWREALFIWWQKIKDRASLFSKMTTNSLQNHFSLSLNHQSDLKATDYIGECLFVCLFLLQITV